MSEPNLIFKKKMLVCKLTSWGGGDHFLPNSFCHLLCQRKFKKKKLSHEPTVKIHQRCPVTTTVPTYGKETETQDGSPSPKADSGNKRPSQPILGLPPQQIHRSDIPTPCGRIKGTFSGSCIMDNFKLTCCAHQGHIWMFSLFKNPKLAADTQTVVSWSFYGLSP